MKQAKEFRDSSTTSHRFLSYYRLEVPKIKEAMLILSWVFFGTSVFHILTNKSIAKIYNSHTDGIIDPNIFVVSSFILYPFLGWLADVYFGRYRVIKWCLRIMWAVSILLCLAFTLFDYYAVTGASLKYAFYVPLLISLGGFLSNLMHFGIDQLADAPSSEITSFIRLSCWLYYFSRLVVVLSQNCICEDCFKLPLLLLPLLLTIAVSSDSIFNNCFVKEPPFGNPLTVIFRYAVKNKCSQLCNAFTCWNNSRVNFGGNPFTSEEVENVKAFWHMFRVIAVGSMFMGVTFNIYPANGTIFRHLQREFDDVSRRWNCLLTSTLFYSGDIIVALFLPIFEFLLYPFLKRHFHISILTKALIGIIFFLSDVIGLIIIEGLGHRFIKNGHSGSNLTYPMNSLQLPNVMLPVSQFWVMIPNTFGSIAQYVFVIASLEFICAQSPYYMKGLLFGLAFGCTGIFTAFFYILLLPIQYAIKKWSSPHYGCEMWYLVSILFFLLVFSVTFYVLRKVYKKRNRNSDLYNEQMFTSYS